ncbi:MAG: copper resistance protein NlpE [Candidatus Margulisiibacteriota bacterium]
MKMLFSKLCTAVVLGTVVGSAVWAAPMMYRGTMPCADCSGIDTTLTLNGDPHATQGTFTSRQVYMGGRNPRTVSTSGTWTMTHGYGNDPNAMVYTLRSSSNAAPMYYVESGGSLQMLDRNRQSMPNNGRNYRLNVQATANASASAKSRLNNMNVTRNSTTSGNPAGTLTTPGNMRTNVKTNVDTSVSKGKTTGTTSSSSDTSTSGTTGTSGTSGTTSGGTSTDTKTGGTTTGATTGTTGGVSY